MWGDVVRGAAPASEAPVRLAVLFAGNGFHSKEWWAKGEGKAILVISHDEPYFDIADRVLRLQDGRLLEEAHVGCGGTWA